MAGPELPCVELVEVVGDWLEGALDEGPRLAVEEHLAICPHCVAYLDQIRLAVKLMGAEDEPVVHTAPPPGARAALLEAFRRERG